MSCAHALCVRSAADGHFGTFRVLALVNEDAAHVGEKSSLGDSALIFCPYPCLCHLPLCLQKWDCWILR